MKFLINSDFKAIRKGEMVVADEKVGEFIYQTGNAGDASTAQLKEIAKANKIKLEGTKIDKQTLIQKIDEALMSNKDIAEQNTPTETQKVEEIVKAGVAAGKSDDAMLVDIVTAGVSFKRATKLFKQVLEANGLRVSAKDRNTKAAEILANIEFNPQSAADVEGAVKVLTEKVEDTNAKQALSAIKSYAKAHEIELPKVAKGQRGQSGFRAKVYGWIMSNPTATEAEFVAFVASQEKPEAVQKRFAGIFRLAHEFAAQQVKANAGTNGAKEANAA